MSQTKVQSNQESKVNHCTYKKSQDMHIKFQESSVSITCQNVNTKSKVREIQEKSFSKSGSRLGYEFNSKTATGTELVMKKIGSIPSCGEIF